MRGCNMAGCGYRIVCATEAAIEVFVELKCNSDHNRPEFDAKCKRLEATRVENSAKERVEMIFAFSGTLKSSTHFP